MILNTINDLHMGRVVERYYEDGVVAVGMVVNIDAEAKKFEFEVMSSSREAMIGAVITVNQYHSHVDGSGWRFPV